MPSGTEQIGLFRRLIRFMRWGRDEIPGPPDRGLLLFAGTGEVDGFAARHGLTFAPGVRKVLIESLPLATIA